MDLNLYSRTRSAECLGISVRTLDLLISLKVIRPTRIGRRVLIRKQELDRISRNGSNEAGDRDGSNGEGDSNEQ